MRCFVNEELHAVMFTSNHLKRFLSDAASTDPTLINNMNRILHQNRIEWEEYKLEAN